MAVYTPLSTDSINPWLNSLSLGKAVLVAGIQEGIENSNYFIDTEHPHPDTASTQFVLTIFERTPPEHLVFYRSWLKHLFHRGLSVPLPIGYTTLKTLDGDKPALLVSRLHGEKVLSPTPAHCYAVGKWLANLHLNSPTHASHCGEDGIPFEEALPIPPNPRGLAWQRSIVPSLLGHISQEDERIVLSQGEMIWKQISAINLRMDLPQGAIHADLFRDNLMFARSHAHHPPQVSAVFDFFFGGFDSWVFDLAVTINDWCAYDSAELQADHFRALLHGYEQIRSLQPQENSVLPLMLCFAALRFYLSRLADVAYPRPGRVIAHDPRRFREMFLARLKITAFPSH